MKFLLGACIINAVMLSLSPCSFLILYVKQLVTSSNIRNR